MQSPAPVIRIEHAHHPWYMFRVVCRALRTCCSVQSRRCSLASMALGLECLVIFCTGMQSGCHHNSNTRYVVGLLVRHSIFYFLRLPYYTALAFISSVLPSSFAIRIRRLCLVMVPSASTFSLVASSCAQHLQHLILLFVATPSANSPLNHLSKSQDRFVEQITSRSGLRT